jgi:PAS domain S-box-containing protein
MDPVRWEKHPLQIISFIILSTVIIFYIDIITPLGFMFGILYFIPLFLTVYIHWRYGPYLVTCVSIVLIGIGFVLAPRDVSELFALVNRMFFSLMLIISAVFIRNFTRNVENLRINEERYRHLTEWSPDAILVHKNGRIIYTNPAALHLFATINPENLIGKNLVDLVNPADRDLIQQRMNQAMMGARIESLEARMVRLNQSEFRAEASVGKITWDDNPAIQIVLRDISQREEPCR